MRLIRQRADLALLGAALLAWVIGALVDWTVDRAPPRLVREDLRIAAPHGRYSLAVTVLRPGGDGPYGAVILNHGVSPDVARRAAESPELLLHAAAAFAQHSYAVFLPLRRGFGATGGALAEDAGYCDDPDYGRAERAAAQDVLLAYRFARTLPYVDPSRMILAGQSAGGVAALKAAAQGPEGLVAVLAFAAGRGADPASPGVPCAAPRLGELFAELGRSVRAPALLYYAQNDGYFGPQASQSWFKMFKAGGARGEYVLQPPFGADGHYLFTDRAGATVWLPVVERFLRRHDIPFERRRDPV